MRLLINARNRSVAVEGARIVREGGGYDAILDLPDADIRPGLINAHDHLHRNHYGKLGRPLYVSARHWAADIQVRYRRRIANGNHWPRRRKLLAGAWKNLFAGVTTVAHHDPWEMAFESGFPLRVARVASANSVDECQDLGTRRHGEPYCLHLAEGIDRHSADELRLLDERGLVTSDLVAVHGVGLDTEGEKRLHDAGAAIAWCPTSNIFMLGRTAPASLLTSGIDVVLGSDSLLTGAGNLLDELRFARAQRCLADQQLAAAVGPTAARRFDLHQPSLDPGAVADLVLLRRPVLEAHADDVALVLVDGRPRVADPSLTAPLERNFGPGTTRTVGGVTRRTWMPDTNSPRGTAE